MDKINVGVVSTWRALHREMLPRWSKTVLQEGRGLYRPNELTTVKVDVVGRYCTTDGCSEDVFDRREGVSMKIGEAGNILSQMLEDCICSMRSGEKCELNVELQTLRDTSLGSMPDVPDDCTKVVYSVYLLSFERGKDVWKLSNQERVELAKRHKTLGTDIFKAGDIKAVAVHYSKALKYLIPEKVDDALQESFQKDILALRNVTLLNLAACQLKFKQDHYAAQNCSEVLQTEPENIKALYRRGLALTNMSDFDQAKQDLVKARRLEPKNRAIEEQLRTLEMKIQAQRNKYRDALKSMFGDKPQSL